MAGLITQGVQITAVKASFNSTANTDDDFAIFMGWQVDWGNNHVRVEPELFRDKGTTAASITFKEEVVETLCDIFQAHILYEIYKSS